MDTLLSMDPLNYQMLPIWQIVTFAIFWRHRHIFFVRKSLEIYFYHYRSKKTKNKYFRNTFELARFH